MLLGIPSKECNFHLYRGHSLHHNHILVYMVLYTSLEGLDFHMWLGKDLLHNFHKFHAFHILRIFVMDKIIFFFKINIIFTWFWTVFNNYTVSIFITDITGITETSCDTLFCTDTLCWLFTCEWTCCSAGSEAFMFSFTCLNWWINNFFI